MYINPFMLFKAINTWPNHIYYSLSQNRAHSRLQCSLMCLTWQYSRSFNQNLYNHTYQKAQCEASCILNIKAAPCNLFNIFFHTSRVTLWKSAFNCKGISWWHRFLLLLSRQLNHINPPPSVISLHKRSRGTGSFIWISGKTPCSKKLEGFLIC